MIYLIKISLKLSQPGTLLIYNNIVRYSFKSIEHLNIDLRSPHEACGIIPVHASHYRDEVFKYRMGLYDSKIKLNEVKCLDKEVF